MAISRTKGPLMMGHSQKPNFPPKAHSGFIHFFWYFSLTLLKIARFSPDFSPENLYSHLRLNTGFNTALEEKSLNMYYTTLLTVLHVSFNKERQ